MGTGLRTQEGWRFLPISARPARGTAAQPRIRGRRFTRSAIHPAFPPQTRMWSSPRASTIPMEFNPCNSSTAWTPRAPTPRSQCLTTAPAVTRSPVTAFTAPRSPAWLPARSSHFMCKPPMHHPRRHAFRPIWRTAPRCASASFVLATWHRRAVSARIICGSRKT